MLVKDTMSLGKRSKVSYFTGMLLMLSLLLQCAVFTTAAVNANNTSKSDSFVNGTHFDNRTQRAVASKSVTNAKSAIKPTATDIKSVKSPPKEPVKPTKNNGNPVEPLSTLSKVNNASNIHKNNQTAKTIKAKNVDFNDIHKSIATSSKAVNINATASTGITKINRTSPIAKVNETTTKSVASVHRTTVYPILDEAESMFWSSEDDSPNDVPDTNPTVNAPATSKEGIKPFLMDLPEPLNNPGNASIELLLVTDEEGSGETTEPTATNPVPTNTETPVPSNTTTPVSATTTIPVPTTTRTPVPPNTTTAVPTTRTTIVPTTTTGIVTTTGLTATVPPTYENVDPNFGMNFDLSVQVPYEDYLEDSTDQRYIDLATEVEAVINNAFKGCWGFVDNSARVLDFYNATWRGQVTKGNNPVALADEKFDTTGTNYNVTFVTAQVFEHPDWVYDFIAKNATYTLEDSVIANSSVSAGDMTQSAQDQIKDLTAAPCQVLACPSCYRCAENNNTALGNVTTQTAYCGFLCESATEQCSIVDNSNGVWVGECTCKKGYLAFAGDCAKEENVIGGIIGIVLAIIVGFTIALIIVCCKKSSDKDKKDIESDSEAPIGQDDDAPMPEDSKIESPAEEAITPSAPSDHGLIEEQSVRPITNPTVAAEIETPREGDRGDDDDEEVIINFRPNLSNVDDEYLSRDYAIRRARVSSPSLDETQDYLRDNFYF